MGDLHHGWRCAWVAWTSCWQGPGLPSFSLWSATPWCLWRSWHQLPPRRTSCTLYRRLVPSLCCPMACGRHFRPSGVSEWRSPGPWMALPIARWACTDTGWVCVLWCIDSGGMLVVLSKGENGITAIPGTGSSWPGATLDSPCHAARAPGQVEDLSRDRGKIHEESKNGLQCCCFSVFPCAGSVRAFLESAGSRGAI